MSLIIRKSFGKLQVLDLSIDEGESIAVITSCPAELSARASHTRKAVSA